MKSFAGKLAAALAVAALGVLFMVYSGNDDAPGGVLIGLLMVIGALAMAVRTTLRRGKSLGGRQDADRP